MGPLLQALAQTVTTFLVGEPYPRGVEYSESPAGGRCDLYSDCSSAIGDGLSAISSAAAGRADCRGPQLLQKGTELLNQLVSGIFAALPNIFQAGYSAIAEFGNSIFANLPQVLEAGKNILLNIVSGIAQMLPQLWQSAASMIASLLTGLVQNLPQILAAGFDLVVSLISGIGNALPSLGTAAGQAARKIWDAVKNIDWLQLGKDIISGLINGIGAMAGALWDAAVNIAKSALNAIKSFFGIASPSKVMRDEVGRWIPAGVAEGIEKKHKAHYFGHEQAGRPDCHAPAGQADGYAGRKQCVKRRAGYGTAACRRCTCAAADHLYARQPEPRRVDAGGGELFGKSEVEKPVNKDTVVTYESGGHRIVLHSAYDSALWVTEITGASSNSVAISETQGAAQVGSTISSQSVQPKDITVNGAVLKELEKNRRAILACIAPGNTGRLTIRQGGEGWYIEGAPKTTPVFSDGSKVQSFQFVLHCPYPYFKKHGWRQFTDCWADQAFPLSLPFGGAVVYLQVY